MPSEVPTALFPAPRCFLCHLLLVTQLPPPSSPLYPGKYFYELDKSSVRPGYPKLISDVWGIEGPIDAAFTRINCQGKTYLFKVGRALLVTAPTFPFPTLGPSTCTWWLLDVPRYGHSQHTRIHIPLDVPTSPWPCPAHPY